MPKTNHQKVQFSQEGDYSFADLHSEEAEQAVLGSILLDNNALDKIELEPDDFYISKHITIFREIKKLFDKGEKADIVTLAKPDEIEVSYLTELLSSVPTALHIQSYAEKVKNFALRRNLVEISEQQKSFALDPEVEDPISAAGKTLEQLDKHLGIEVKSPEYIIPEYIDLIKLRKTKKGLIGVLSGIKGIDELTLGFKNKNLIILASGSGIGKTTLALQIAHNAVVKQGKQVLYFCVEMGDSDLTDRLMANHFSISFSEVMKGNIGDIKEKIAELKSFPLFIIDDPNIAIEQLKSYTSAYQRKYGIDMIVFDYLQLASDKGNDSETKRISDISRGLKKLAMELEIPVIALSQFSRDYEKENRTPSKKDLRWSGSIEQDSDMIIVLHRNKAIDDPDCKDYSLDAKLWLEKNRQGKLGQVDLLFTPEFMRFEEVYNV